MRAKVPTSKFDSSRQLPPNEPPVRLRHSGFRFRSGWTGLPTEPIQGHVSGLSSSRRVALLTQLPSFLSLSSSLRVWVSPPSRRPDCVALGRLSKDWVGPYASMGPVLPVERRFALFL